MKPFDLEKALSGERCVTRDGQEAYVKYREDRFGIYPLRGIVVSPSGKVAEETWTLDGRGTADERESGSDLFMAPKKRTVWVNIHKTGNAIIHASEELADEAVTFTYERIGGRAYPVEIDDE